MVYRVYGIPNCSTVKKARDWLEAHHREYAFHDYKKSGIAPDTVRAWLDEVPLDTLLNRRGTTWRALDDAAKAQADTIDGAIALMVDKPSLIKRPVVVLMASSKDAERVVAVGFSTESYDALK
jgi:arsenate reductase